MDRLGWEVMMEGQETRNPITGERYDTIPADVTVTITIGRNVGAEPMTFEVWGRFKRELRYTLKVNDAIVYFRGTGEGEWEDKVEIAHTIVASIPESFVPSLRRRLYGLAQGFKQDAIALTVGTTYLVGPNV